MKRFLLFYGQNYYPDGGWRDYIGAYDSLEEAQRRLIGSYHYDWHQIVDTTTGQIVDES